MEEPISDHIAAIAAGRDASRLLRVAAPDHSVPVAREWLRRWGPSRGAAVVPGCSCAAGRCTVCN